MLVILWVVIFLVVIIDKFCGMLIIGVGFLIELDWLIERYFFFIVSFLIFFILVVKVVGFRIIVVVIFVSLNFKIVF